MKQAYLITAYKDYESLRELVGILTKTGLCFIHVDARSRSITDENIAALNTVAGCKAVREYAVRWGSFAHVRAIVRLMMMALEEPEAVYMHLLTGEDFPLVSPDRLDALFLADRREQIYMSYMTPDELTETVTKRYRYYNLFQDHNIKNKLLWLLQDLTVRLQALLGIRRRGIGAFDDTMIYKGLVYISMPREAAGYAVAYISSHKKFWEDLKCCQLPEEFLFQTIFMNSEKWSARVVKKELRYMDWSKGDGASPCYLEAEHYEEIVRARQDGCLFARKFHPQKSLQLRRRLQSEWEE